MAYSVAGSVGIVVLAPPEPVSRPAGTLTTPFAIPAISKETKGIPARFVAGHTALTHTARWLTAPCVKSEFFNYCGLCMFRVFFRDDY